MKYIIVLIVLIGASGAFLFATQKSAVPAEQPAPVENPFGDGSNVVGSLNDDAMENEAKDESAPTAPVSGGGTPAGGSTGGVPPTGGTTGSSAGTAGIPGAITRTELGTHSTQADCWIGYKGVVYDITNWLPRHPGSAGAIAPFCGTADEFASAFNRKHGTGKEGKLQKEGVNQGPLGN